MTLDVSARTALRRVARLSNDELESELVALVQRDRHLTAELLVHLGEVDARRVHTRWAFSSLFRYCVEALHFSEDEAYKRITAARVVRRFPVALERVQSGKLHLSGLLALAPHLTHENHLELLGAACAKTKREVEKLVAERFPRPDMPASVRRLPDASPEASGTDTSTRLAPPSAVTTSAGPSASSADSASMFPLCAPRTETAGQKDDPEPIQATFLQATSLRATSLLGVPERPAASVAMVQKARPSFFQSGSAEHSTARSPDSVPSTPIRPADRPRIEPLASRRYRVAFTASAELIEKLERAKELASHMVAPSDLAALFERALDALVGREEKRRFAVGSARNRASSAHERNESTGVAAARDRKEWPASPSTPGRREPSVPPEDLAPERVSVGPLGSSDPAVTQPPQAEARVSRYVPADVRRRVFERDGGQCTFVDPKTGRRCNERRFIEFEHIDPHALGGAATVANLTLRCSAHNALAARRVFGEQYVAAAVARGRGKLRSRERRC